MIKKTRRTPLPIFEARSRFKRAPYLLCYWGTDHLIIDNFLLSTRVAVHPMIVRVLHACGRWRSSAWIEANFKDAGAEAVRRTVTELVEHGLLITSGLATSIRQRELAKWKHWNPVAGFFHLATRDEPYEKNASEALRWWREKAHQIPPATKVYSGARIALPPVETSGEFVRVLQERRTWRAFSRETVSLDDLATLLHLTWGVQRWGLIGGKPRIALKTSPSGGARHPGEVYVLALSVKGLRPGLYHYASGRHCLTKLRSGASQRDLDAYLPGQTWYRSAAALLLMTAVFSRAQWRYKTPRAYRAVLLDAGHLCQTCCLTATWLGLAPFCSMAFADSRIERDLGIDGVSESMIYVAGIGSRPPEGWVPLRPHGLGQQ